MDVKETDIIKGYLSYIMLQFDKAIDDDQLSYYIRVFGNDIRAGDIYQFNTDAIKSQFNFLDWMIELSKQHNIDLIKNWQFLDTTLSIPTGTGMLSSLCLGYVVIIIVVYYANRSSA